MDFPHSPIPMAYEKSSLANALGDGNSSCHFQLVSLHPKSYSVPPLLKWSSLPASPFSFTFSFQSCSLAEHLIHVSRALIWTAISSKNASLMFEILMKSPIVKVEIFPHVRHEQLSASTNACSGKVAYNSLLVPMLGGNIVCSPSSVIEPLNPIPCAWLHAACMFGAEHNKHNPKHLSI